MYSRGFILYLIGVDKYGLRFNLIAKNIKFSTKRSAKTLKQKYQSVIKVGTFIVYIYYLYTCSVGDSAKY